MPEDSTGRRAFGRGDDGSNWPISKWRQGISGFCKFALGTRSVMLYTHNIEPRIKSW